MDTLENILKELNNNAEERGKCRCQTCGFKYKKDEAESHDCTQFMVPKDVLRAVLVGEELVDLKSLAKLSEILNLNN